MPKVGRAGTDHRQIINLGHLDGSRRVDFLQRSHMLVVKSDIELINPRRDGGQREMNTNRSVPFQGLERLWAEGCADRKDPFAFGIGDSHRKLGLRQR